MTSNGGAERARTADLCVANAALSQLSYGPTSLEFGPRFGIRGGDLHRSLYRSDIYI